MCSICLDTLKDPKTLSCNHALCNGCIERHVLQNGRNGMFACPLCYREVKISRDDVNSENYCQVCSEVHIKMKSSRNHKLRDLAVLDWEELVAPRRRIYCLEHLEEEIKLVCKACKNLPICQFCKILKHDTHPSRILADEAMQIRSILEKNLTLCTEQLEYLELCTRNSEARAEEQDASQQEEIWKIIHQEDDLVCLLQYLNERIKIQAEQLKRDKRQRYTKARKENDAYKADIAMEKIKYPRLQGEAKELINTTTDFEVIKKNMISCNTNHKQVQRIVITPAAIWMQSIETKVLDLVTAVTKEEERKMTIFLRWFLSSTTHCQEVDRLQKIETITKTIAERFGLEGTGDFVLRFAGKKLKNEKRLCIR
ncbi:hypothetical protein ACJMK2_018910 [Sinanodonta woodiana]|uniref:RING-type domain-containing protein n=1 Tax=Sinanodonta woodiana TaxID=1069815 RepID=A0ABD3UGU9_SINWO